jgi:hypothetical protein
MKQRDPYIAIMIANDTQVGLHLSKEEVAELAKESVIIGRAYLALNEEQKADFELNGWKGLLREQIIKRWFS